MQSDPPQYQPPVPPVVPIYIPPLVPERPVVPSLAEPPPPLPLPETPPPPGLLYQPKPPPLLPGPHMAEPQAMPLEDTGLPKDLPPPEIEVIPPKLGEMPVRRYSVPFTRTLDREI